MITDTALRFEVNGRGVEVRTDGRRRLVDVLREDLGLTGTKVGCNAGDCGACTVRLDGEQVCACLVAAGQVDGPARRDGRRSGRAGGPVAAPGRLPRLRRRPVRRLHAGDADGGRRPHRAQPEPDGTPRCSTAWAACSAGAPATRRSSRPSARRASGGVAEAPAPAVGAAVGARIARTDGLAKVTGAELFGDDLPADGRLAACGRSARHTPMRGSASATSAAVLARHPGLVRILAAADVPGPQPVRDLRDRQGPAGPRRGLRPVPGRGGAGARRRRGDRGLRSPTTSCRSPGSRCRP